MIACGIVLGGGKREIVLSSPLLGAAGAFGYDPPPAEMVEWLGAIVTPALTAEPRRGLEEAALVRTTAGYLVRTGRRNPGVRRALRRHGRAWAGCGRPLIVAVYGATVPDLAEAAWQAGECEVAQALELHLPHDAAPQAYGAAVRAARDEAGLPCLVRLAHEAAAAEAARAAEEAGADAVVVAAPPLGRARGAGAAWVTGPLHSPALAPLTAQRVSEVRAATGLPIIARGGLARPDDALAMLAAGACALQMDSILHVDPGAPEAFYAALEAEMARCSAPDWAAYLATLRPEE